MRDIRKFFEDESALCSGRASLVYTTAAVTGTSELVRGEEPEQRIRLITYFVAAYLALC